MQKSPSKINSTEPETLSQKIQSGGGWFCVVLFSALASACTFIALSGEHSEQTSEIGQVLSAFVSRIGIGPWVGNYLQNISGKQIVLTFLVFAVLLFIGINLIYGKTKFLRFCCRKRYIIALIVLTVSVLLELNGTSLYKWSSFLKGAEQYKPILGSAKGIRSDEWAVWSAFAISQGYEGWPAVSQAIAGGNVSTLWISVGGIPALNPALLFKPLYWGFLLLGTARGFSFLWTMRFLLLFLVSFELAMRYTKKNAWLSFGAAMVITFAPYVQWWYSQSVAEVLIFSQAMLLCLDAYVNSNSRKKRILLAVLLAYCIGCYVMVAYISWLISTFYIVLAIAIVILVCNRKQLHKADIPTLLLPAGIVVAYLLIIVCSDWTTINSILNSVYPGTRLVTGGDLFDTASYFTGLYALLLPFIEAPILNSCELSCFLTFAPAGLILACYSAIKTKKKDALSIALIAVELACLYFLIVGVPAVVAKATLLSQCSRMNIALGLADCILLFRNLSSSKGMPLLLVLASALISTACNMIPILCFYQVGKVTLTVLIVLYLTIFYLLYRHQDEKAVYKRILIFSLSCVMLAAGAFVNPIQQGISCVTETNLVKTLVSIENTPGDLYLVEGNWPVTNAPLLAGKACLDSTQAYPDPDKWEAVDPAGQYADVYNRFCHISLNLVEQETSFTKQKEDLISINFCINDLEKYDISYLITTKEYSVCSSCQFTFVCAADEWNVYRVTYPAETP